MRGGPGVVVPVRAFAGGFARLSACLDAAERAALARRCAENVVAAAGSLPVVVVTSAADVRSWATASGLEAIDDPGSLDAAADAGRAWLVERGGDRVVVAHADLPLAATLAPVAGDGAAPVAALVPCHRDDGTPVLSLPASAPFRFTYGPGSFRRHVAEARRIGLEVRVVRDPDLAFDLDIPDDVERLRARERSGA